MPFLPILYVLSKSVRYAMKESKFQSKLISDIKELLPGAMVLKNDANYIQGIPDLMVLYKDRWGALECKNSPNAKVRPNQPYYIETMNDMSFAAFINPDNKEEVLNDLQQALGDSGRKSRVSRRK